MSQLLTIAQFANLLGQQYRKTLEASEPFHKLYGAATPEDQREMRDTWILNHMLGQGLDKAAAIMERSRPGSAGKCRTKAEQQAYDRARTDFGYHVVRAKKSSAKAESAKAPTKVRVTREERAAWDAFVERVGGERAGIIAAALA